MSLPQPETGTVLHLAQEVAGQMGRLPLILMILDHKLPKTRKMVHRIAEF
jgi:hypothetical protein